jgi:hypothetical protein
MKGGKPFLQRVEMSKAKDIRTQFVNDLGRLCFLHLFLDSSEPGLVLEILCKKTTDAPGKMAI